MGEVEVEDDFLIQIQDAQPFAARVDMRYHQVVRAAEQTTEMGPPGSKLRWDLVRAWRRLFGLHSNPVVEGEVTIWSAPDWP